MSILMYGWIFLQQELLDMLWTTKQTHYFKTRWAFLPTPTSDRSTKVGRPGPRRSEVLLGSLAVLVVFDEASCHKSYGYKNADSANSQSKFRSGPFPVEPLKASWLAFNWSPAEDPSKLWGNYWHKKCDIINVSCFNLLKKWSYGIGPMDE